MPPLVPVDAGNVNRAPDRVWVFPLRSRKNRSRPKSAAVYSLRTLGIKVNTSPDNYYPIRRMQLASFNGESWEQFGDVLSG